MQKIFHIIPFLCLCIFSTVEASEQEAAGFIKRVVDESLGIVNSTNKSDDEKRQDLSKCISKYLDVERITEAVFSPLGYRDLSPVDKQKVKEFMKKELIRFYAGKGKLSAMVNAELSGGLVAEEKGKDFAVKTNFIKDSSTVEIVWVTDGQKVFYVLIEGFNQITTLRSEMKGKVGNKPLMNYINEQ